MDKLDKISISAILALIVISVVMALNHAGEARPERNIVKNVSSAPVPNGEIEAQASLIRNLIESDNPLKAQIMIMELLKKYPYEGEPHLLMGDLLMRKQEPIKAMFEYKESIDLNPDYLDKKTPLFQGKKLKIAAAEAMAEIQKKIEHSPGDASARSERKTLYYLQRRIAGSCS